MFSFGNLNSQNLTDSLLVDFFNKTFDDYFTKQKTYYPLTKDFYLRKDSTVPDNVKIDFTNFKLHLLEKYQEYPLIKKGKISELYSARTKHISVDTIDIVIGGWTVNYKRVFKIKKIEGKRKLITGNYNFALWCGGTMGYIPEGRLIYDTELKEWKYITRSEIVNEKIEAEKNMFRKQKE